MVCPRGGTPTRFAVIDDLLPDEVASEIAAAFQVAAPLFDDRNTFRERKSVCTKFDEVPAILRDVTFAFQDPKATAFIGSKTGIDGVAADPTLYAGGLSMMKTGDYLNPHIDNSHDATKTTYRRLNLLYYVTPNWATADGGHLELWDDRVTQPVTIEATFNRLVLMQTDRHSWHSVNEVKGSRPRCCVSNYYFSNESPEGKDYYHVTSFNGRPGQLAQRVVAPFDNRARQLARTLGAKRATDKGFTGAKP